jgi:predicted metal-dependent phosphoesterase TrpH
MASLKPFSTPGRFWRGNLHTHSTLSDGALEPKAVVDAYKKAGYDFMALSDHFVSLFNWPVADTTSFRSNNFTTLIGAELHAPLTSAGELWHILAVGLPLDFAPAGAQESGPQIARRAADAGAFVGIAHPSWSQLTIEDGMNLAFADAVETYNHSCAAENDRGEGFYLLDQLLNKGQRLTAFATDDAHFKTADYFGGWVHVKAESLEPETLLAALKAGQFYASQGPLFHDIALAGKDLSVSCSPVDTITVVCGNSRSCVETGRAITGATLDLAKMEKGFLGQKMTPWFRVTIIDNAGKRAWSNPYWWDEVC